MQLSSKATVLQFLRSESFQTVLDAPSGAGWLGHALKDRAAVDGVDLFDSAPAGYRRFWQQDLDDGLPPDAGNYDLIGCCEGLEHVGNPLRLLRDFYHHLNSAGLLLVTTPNVWYPQARLQYLLRGFFPSFPPLAGKVTPGTHMHITPWSYPQLYVYFRLAGFAHLEIIPEPTSHAKHFHERWVALPARLYCRSRMHRARSPDEIVFWKNAGADASLLGRHLIVVARKMAGAVPPSPTGDPAQTQA